MKKWDDEFRLKNYVNKIQNAKSSVQHHQKPAFKSKNYRETEFSSHASYRSDLTDIKESVLYKQLVEFHLQQYANKLLLRGYATGLQQLATMTQESQNTVLQEIKLLPGHKQKFIDLFKYLSNNYDPHNYNSNGQLTPNNKRQNRNTLPGQQNSNSKFEQTKEIYIDILKPVNRRSSAKHFSPLADFGVIKPRVLPKLQKKLSKNGEIRGESLPKQQQTLHETQLSLTKEIIIKPLSKTVQQPLVKIKSQKQSKSSFEKKQNNDIKIITKLKMLSNQNNDDINLQKDQINLMYQSFENGKLASTLINIDIEEICYCVGTTIQKMIHNIDQQQLQIIENEIQNIQQNIFQDENDNDNEFDQQRLQSVDKLTEEDRFDNEFEQQYKEQYDDEDNNQFNNEAIIEPEYTDQYGDNDEATNQNQEDIQLQEQSQKTEKSLQDNLELSKSYFTADTSYNLDSFLLFHSIFTDKTLPNYLPNVEIIQNYCKNIMITTKMEREVAIISMVYINRLLNCDEEVMLNCLNWQKVLFTALVIASKIWDDESFENNNFAKVLPYFTTVQINEMEKVFLKLIRYNLNVKSGEYAKQYFVLREYADKKQRSYPLKQLDISTVLRLQKGGTQLIQKAQYLTTQNKSF